MAKEPLEQGIDQATRWLWDNQADDGYWVGRLQSNSCMEAEWIMALHFMGLGDDPAYAALRAGMVRALLSEQREDGAWQIYFEAPAGDINATVEAYAALRTAGLDPQDERLHKARAWIVSKGGLSKVRVFTRYWLALIGVWPWEKTPNIPAEVIRFPVWFPFSIYNFASWARATLMPISVLSATRPVAPLPGGDRLDELFPEGRGAFNFSLPRKGKGPISWERFFLRADRILHWLQSAGLVPGRKASVARGVEWIIRHQDADGVWGGIQPPWIYSLMALHAQGYARTHPVMAKGLGALLDERWKLELPGGTYVQACTSPVWDTLLGLLAVQDVEAETLNNKAVVRAVDWVLSKEVRVKGDWAVKVTDTEPGGWSFEYENLSYPDVDDTAVGLMVLSRLRNKPEWREKGVEDVLERARNWVFGMQCDNGGWGAFDKDNSKPILTKIPFSDFGEAVDPPSVDVTAHVLEGLGMLDMGPDHQVVRRGLDFIKQRQRPDGSWFGRWGVNYVYGTGAVLPALHAIGEDMAQPYVTKAADWLLAMQNPDGGWGETCMSYMDPAQSGRYDIANSEGRRSTASQTAWAVMGLVAVDRASDVAAVRRGIDFLLSSQKDGTWDEPEFTGTGFPGYGFGDEMDFDDPAAVASLKQGRELGRGFMINYHMYRHYFPMMAMGRVRKYLARHGWGMNRTPDKPGQLERDVAAFLGEVGCAAPEVLLDRLRADHSREATPYHSWAHILHGLGLVWEYRTAIPEFEAVVLAWLNHGRIYDPRGTENEEKSAELGRDMCLEVGRPDLANRVHALILDTRHQVEPNTPAGRWIVGIDLAILGETPERYDRFERNIAVEYAHVPKMLYRVGRGRILRGFLERDRIYGVPELHERFEHQARVNLQKAIDAL